MAATGKKVWVGWAITILVSLLFLFSATMKLIGGEGLAEGFNHLGLQTSFAVPLGILELAPVA